MICIFDLFDSKGIFVTQESIINSNVKNNFVEHLGLIKAILEYIGIYNMTPVRQKVQPYI